MVYNYINISIRGSYIDYDYELTAENGHDLGSTYDDYLKGKWVLLSAEQHQFKQDNTGASIKEVLDMKLVVPTEQQLLQQAVGRKTQELDEYRHSSAVKTMTYNDNMLWIDQEDRIPIKDRCQVAYKRGQDTIKVGYVYIAPEIAIEIIDKLQEYDEVCDEVLSDKKKEVSALTVANDVDAYDVMSGYPAPVVVDDQMIAKEIEAYNAKNESVQATSFVKSIVNDFPMSANEALEKQVLFPVWGGKYAEIGKNVEPGFRFNYTAEGQESPLLYEAIQAHALSSTWVPGIGTESIYKVVQYEHQGTIDDPIPWTPNMELFKDKYYTEDGVLYVCIRSSEIALSYKLSELISGGYVEVVIQ